VEDIFGNVVAVALAVDCSCGVLLVVASDLFRLVKAADNMDVFATPDVFDEGFGNSCVLNLFLELGTEIVDVAAVSVFDLFVGILSNG